MVNPNDPTIEFCLVDDQFAQVSRIGNITYFPDETTLRVYRLEHKNVIWLQELLDPNCKKCYGRGQTGKRIYKSDVPDEQIKLKIHELIDTQPELLPNEIVKLMKLAPNLEKPLVELVKVIQGEISDDAEKNMKVAAKYAKMIKKDFVITEIQYCTKCFLPRYNEKVAEIRRNVKFETN
jgi:hypothetical protein